MGFQGSLTDIKAFIKENSNIDWLSPKSTAILYEAFDCDTKDDKKKMRGYKSNALKAMGLKTGSVATPRKTVKPPQKVDQMEIPGLPKVTKLSGKTVKYGLAIEKEMLKEFKKALIDREESGADVIRGWIQQYIEENR